MPICEVDPWRMQYFADVPCPDDVRIPTEDADAWAWNPGHRWVYDRLAIAATQGIAAGSHDTTPATFPVFSKPIVNLRGMGLGARVIASPDDYDRQRTSGHMWMTLLQGRHVSTDVAVLSGQPRWWRHALGLPAGGGTFDYWIIGIEPEAGLQSRLDAWIQTHLDGYTGLVNVESIGGAIIEVHLRLTDQWPDLYGPGWVTAVIGLYGTARWDFVDTENRRGYSVALFGAYGPRYRHPPEALSDEVRRTPGISSLQITFHEDRDPRSHAMPDGGFRLAVINCCDLDAGVAARERLGAHFAAQARAPEVAGDDAHVATQ